MAKQARRLGRGLDSLVSDLRVQQQPAPTMKPGSADRSADPSGSPVSSHGPSNIMMPVGSLEPNPFQPRQTFSEVELESLANSIRRNGVLQPIVVRYHEGTYQIIAGERRWRAAKQAGHTSVPVIIRKAEDEQALELAMVENLQREDLNPIERARAYASFCSRFSLKAEEVAERLGEDRSTVANYMRLLDLEDVVQGLVAVGQLSMGHARCLLGVADGAKRLNLAESAARNELSVRALEEIVRRQRGARDASEANASPKGKTRSPHLRDLQTRFEQALQTKVTIHEGKRKGSGRIVIQYFSLDDFDRIAERVGLSVD